VKIISASLIFLGELRPPTFSGRFIKMFSAGMFNLLVACFTYR